MDYLFKDVEKYGLIFVTRKGEDFFKQPHEVLLTEDRDFKEAEDDDDIATIGSDKHHGGGGDEILLNMLKDVRHSLSKRMKLPPFVIFNDPSLEDMSIMYPTTIDELKNCQGVGEGKAKKFGKEFIQLISKYVDENEITRPTEFIVKSVVNKSLNKVFIIQNIDRRTPLEDIAEEKNMDMDQLLTEVETIVASGTKINLDYYIRQNIDEDKIRDIYEYFKDEALTDSIKDALKALGPDYEENEVRLIRIKLLSELGN